MDKNMNIRMSKLRDQFLKNIDDFFKENPQENILTPIATLLGSVIVLLGGYDTNNKFQNELVNLTEKMLNDSMSLLEKIANIMH